MATKVRLQMRSSKKNCEAKREEKVWGLFFEECQHERRLGKPRSSEEMKENKTGKCFSEKVVHNVECWLKVKRNEDLNEPITFINPVVIWNNTSVWSGVWEGRGWRPRVKATSWRSYAKKRRKWAVGRGEGWVKAEGLGFEYGKNLNSF